MKDGAPSIVVLFDSARSAEPPHSSGKHAAERGEHLAARGARRHVLAGREGRERVDDVGGQRARQQAVEQTLALGVGGRPGVEPGLPLRVRRGPALDGLAGVRENGVVDLEGLLGVEAEHLLDGGELLGTERRSVDAARVLLARARPADDRLQDDERRLVGLALRRLDRRVELGDVLDVVAGLLPVDGLHVPVVGLVALRDVFRERDVGVVLDRDLVRVVDDDEVAELLVAGERGGLAGHALLEVAIARDDVDVVVEGAGARGCVRVEQAALVAGGVGESDGRGESLAERPGGDLDAVGVAVLGVAGGLRTPGAQGLEVVELEAVAGEEQLDVLGQRAVPGRQDETVATQPLVIVRIAAHDLLEQQVRGGSQAHRGAGVAVAHLLHGVGGENTCRVHRLVVERVPGECCHVSTFRMRCGARQGPVGMPLADGHRRRTAGSPQSHQESCCGIGGPNRGRRALRL